MKKGALKRESLMCMVEPKPCGFGSKLSNAFVGLSIHWCSGDK